MVVRAVGLLVRGDGLLGDGAVRCAAATESEAQQSARRILDSRRISAGSGRWGRGCGLVSVDMLTQGEGERSDYTAERPEDERG